MEGNASHISPLVSDGHRLSWPGVCLFLQAASTVGVGPAVTPCHVPLCSGCLCRAPGPVGCPWKGGPRGGEGIPQLPRDPTDTLPQLTNPQLNPQGVRGLQPPSPAPGSCLSREPLLTAPGAPHQALHQPTFHLRPCSVIGRQVFLTLCWESFTHIQMHREHHSLPQIQQSPPDGLSCPLSRLHSLSIFLATSFHPKYFSLHRLAVGPYIFSCVKERD